MGLGRGVSERQLPSSPPAPTTPPIFHGRSHKLCRNPGGNLCKNLSSTHPPASPPRPAGPASPPAIGRSRNPARNHYKKTEAQKHPPASPPAPAGLAPPQMRTLHPSALPEHPGTACDPPPRSQPPRLALTQPGGTRRERGRRKGGGGPSSTGSRGRVSSNAAGDAGQAQTPSILHA